jgi:hypothetical protein
MRLVSCKGSQENDMPRYQFKASDGVGALKYSIALLSTSRRAGGNEHAVSENPGARVEKVPFPCTILAGCGNVCMRNTAHKSTGDVGSWPSEGSRHRTRRSLHRIPISGRGVSSGARQSTCTVDASPWAFMASKDTTALRTTRVSNRGPSIISRLFSTFISAFGQYIFLRGGLTDGVAQGG